MVSVNRIVFVFRLGLRTSGSVWEWAFWHSARHLSSILIIYIVIVLSFLSDMDDDSDSAAFTILIIMVQRSRKGKQNYEKKREKKDYHIQSSLNMHIYNLFLQYCRILEVNTRSRLEPWIACNIALLDFCSLHINRNIRFIITA